MKKFISIFLAVLMLVSIMPLSVFAENVRNISDSIRNTKLKGNVTDYSTDDLLDSVGYELKGSFDISFAKFSDFISQKFGAHSACYTDIDNNGQDELIVISIEKDTSETASENFYYLALSCFHTKNDKYIYCTQVLTERIVATPLASYTADVYIENGYVYISSGYASGIEGSGSNWQEYTTIYSFKNNSWNCEEDYYYGVSYGRETFSDKISGTTTNSYSQIQKNLEQKEKKISGTYKLSKADDTNYFDSVALRKSDGFSFVVKAVADKYQPDLPTNPDNPYNAVEFNGHFYKAFDESLSWYDAKSACEDMGGHLVTITSQNEQNFLIELVRNFPKQNVWIGATKVNDKFEWITGENFNEYTNWESGEPNNVFNQQDSLMMYTAASSYNSVGTWNDENGNGRNWDGYYLSDFGYICEWDSENDSENTGDVIASGTCGANGDNQKWTLYKSGELVISGSGKTSAYGTELDSIPWYPYCDQITSVTIKADVTNIFPSAFYGKNMTTFYVESENKYYTSDENGFLFNKDKTSLLSVPAATPITEYTVPSYVTSIAGSAFFCNLNLSNIVLPDGITTIEHDTFAGSNIQSIYIPASVTIIDDWAFCCEQLQTVYYAGTEEQWNSINIKQGFWQSNDGLTNADIIYNATMPDTDPDPEPTDKNRFDKNKYVADIWLNNRDDMEWTMENVLIETVMQYNGEVSKGFYDSLMSDEDFVTAINTWKGVEYVMDPATGSLKDYITKEKLYQTVLGDLINEIINNDAVKETYAAKAVELTKNMQEYFATGVEIRGINYKIEDFPKLQLDKKNGGDIWKLFFEKVLDNACGDVSDKFTGGDMLDVAGTILDYAKTANDCLTKISIYRTAAQLSDDMWNALIKMRDITTSKDLKKAINTLLNASYNKKDNAAILTALNGATVDVAMIVGDMALGMLYNAIPIYREIRMLTKAGTVAFEIIFGTKSIIDACVLLDVTSDICTNIKKTVTVLGNEYLQNDSSQTAGAYIASVELFFNSIKIDLDGTANAMDVAYNKGLVHLDEKIASALLEMIGFEVTSTYEDFMKSSESTVETKKEMFDFLEVNWVLNKDYLMTDYPDQFEFYASDALKSKKQFIPRVLNAYINNEGDTVLNMGTNAFISYYCDGYEVNETTGSDTNKYVFTIKENPLYCDSQPEFPKTYNVSSIIYEDDDSYITSGTTPTKTIKNPLETPQLTLNLARTAGETYDRNRRQFAIYDFTDLRYSTVKYNIYRSYDNYRYEFIGSVDRNKTSHLTVFTEQNSSANRTAYYKVQSEYTFADGTVLKSNNSNVFSEKYNSNMTSFQINTQDLRRNNNMRTVALTENSESGIEISWDKITGASGYEIYRAESFSKMYELVATVNTTKYVDTTVSEGLTYDYFIIAFSNSFGGTKTYSSNSNISTVTYHSLKIDESVTTFTVNQSYQLTAYSTVSNDRFSWTSSDSLVAKVSANGTLTALRPGEATITVTNSLGMTNSVTIRVEKKTETHTHTYASAVTPPTCTQQGYTTYTCSCGNSYTADYMPAKGHTHGEWVIVQEAGFDVSGLRQKKCTVCSEVVDEQTIPSFTQSYDDGITRFYLDIPDNIKADETFDIVLYCSDIYDFDSGVITFSYNPRMLQLVTTQTCLIADLNRQSVNEDEGIIRDAFIFTKKCRAGDAMVIRYTFRALQTGNCYVEVFTDDWYAPSKPENLGKTITIKSDTNTTVTGDVNGDGKLTASDARAALRMSAKLETYTPEQFAAADVNGDGKITASDARIILRVAAKLQTF